MQKKDRIQVRQLVDWRAAIIAGAIAGIISLASNILISNWLLDSPWLFIRIIASVLLGEGVLPPPDDFSWSILAAGFGIHLIISVFLASLIAAVVHQWGILISFVGGALMGLAFYAINFYTLSILFPWFYTFRSWIFLVLHVLYGAFTGSIYELIEVERYTPVEQEEA
jgi:hypothetical protein